MTTQNQTKEHFHLLIYAKGFCMYDLKRDRIDAVDQALRMMCSLYTDNEEDYNNVYVKMSEAMAKEPDDEFNIGFPVEQGSPVQFAIYHCDDPEECAETVSPALN